MKKRIFICCLFLVFIISSLYSNVLAVTVTESNLETALNEFASLNTSTDELTITMYDNYFNVSSTDGDNFDVYFENLEEEPTFTVTIPIEQGISYSEYELLTDGLFGPMLGYLAVANIQGADMEDVALYFIFSYMATVDDPNTSEYTVVELADGVTYESDDDKTVIDSSDFGEYVMEYTASLYGEKITATDIGDSDDYLGSYTYTIEMTDVTDTSCNLVAKVKINLDADYTAIAGIVSSENDNTVNTTTDNNTSNNTVNNIANTSSNTTNNVVDNTVATGTLPNAGKNIIIYAMILLIIGIALMLSTKIEVRVVDKNKKDNKK